MVYKTKTVDLGDLPKGVGEMDGLMSTSEGLRPVDNLYDVFDCIAAKYNTITSNVAVNVEDGDTLTGQEYLQIGTKVYYISGGVTGTVSAISTDSFGELTITTGSGSYLVQVKYEATESQEQALGDDKKIYPRDPYSYVLVGSEIPETFGDIPITHIRILSSTTNKIEIRELNTSLFGTVSAISDSSLTTENGTTTLLSVEVARTKFSSISDLLAYTGVEDGVQYTTGVTVWLANTNGDGELTANGVYVRPLNDIYISDFGVAGDGSDESTELQAAIDFCKTSYNSTKGNFDYVLNGGNLIVTTEASIDLTHIRQPFFTIKDLTVYGKCANKIVLDLLGTNSPRLINVRVYGDETSTPLAGFVYGREELNSAAAISPNVFMSNCQTRGYFIRAGVINIASEVETLEGCYISNASRLQAAYAYACIGHAGTLTEYWNGLVSDYVTVPTSAVGTMSNILHNHNQCQFLRQADVVIDITSITQASPAVVTVDATDLVDSGLDDGDLIFLHDIEGMTELNGATYTVANIDTAAGTFELSGIDSSAYTAFSSGRVWNNTGPAVLLNGAKDVDWRASYILAYGSPSIVVDLVNGTPIGSCKLSFQSESQNQRVIRLDGDTTTKVIQRFELNLLNNSQAHSNSFIQLTGGGSIRIDGLKLYISNLPSAPANGIFAPAASFTLRGADIYSPLEAALNAETAFASFSGSMYAADTDAWNLYGATVN